MSDSGRLSKETRKRILDVAEEMGYIRDGNASRLRTGHSALIGVILNTVKNPFFSELVASLEMAAYDGGYLTLLATTQNDPVRQKKLLHSMISQGVGAMIISPVHGLLAATARRKIPTVVCVRDLPNQERVFVGADEMKSGYLAASHLIKNGHRSMTFLGGTAAPAHGRGAKTVFCAHWARLACQAKTARFVRGLF